MNFTDYFQAYKNYFFLWEEDAGVLSIPGGSTIAFREQVSEILMALAENGLPPFGSFLLVMIAANKTMDESLKSIKKDLTGYLKSVDKFQIGDEDLINEAFAFLKILGDLNQEYKVGQRRQIFMQTIFADSHNRLGSSTSKGIAITLKNLTNGRYKLQVLKEFNYIAFTKDFRVITLLARNYPTAQSIIDAMGPLPALQSSEIPELETAAVTERKYENFVEELLDNPKTFQIAALIKPIWAGFNIPIFSAHPSAQPLGGVSDLSNKGDYDKLLISEFANDDLIFMNRIANNEALYLHREMPPVKDNLHRVILLDISLKNWGTPKLLAFAAYIAIARHPKAAGEVTAFIVGNDITKVSCSSAGEIIDGLQLVDAALHSAKGLNIFLEANKHDRQLELFYITAAEALRYAEVQQQLALHGGLFKYIITTNDDGEINFYRRKNNTQKHLQKIILPLNKLWTKKVVPKQLTEKIKEVLNSGVLLLYPSPAQVTRLLPLNENDVYCVKERSLLRRSIFHNTKRSKGWELVLQNVCISGMYEIGKLQNGEIIFLAFKPQNKELCITNVQTGQSAKVFFTEWRGKSFPQFLFHTSERLIWLVKNPEAYEFEPNFETGIISISKINLSSEHFILKYPARQKMIAEYPISFYSGNTLRSIHTVYINKANYLVFTKHQLHVTDNEQLYLTSQGHNLEQAFLAERKSKSGEFIFKDGSTVMIDRNGHILLVSSNTSIPKIVVSAQIDFPLGMATEKYFAGHEYFRDERLGKASVVLKKADNKLAAIKIIKSYVPELGLKDAKEMVDAAPAIISKTLENGAAEEMTVKLLEIGCEAEVYVAEQTSQAVITPQAFYNENIAKFIGHIINYESANKTIVS